MELLNDCEKCMLETPREHRQLMACGYEPPVELGRAWSHAGMTPRDEHDKLSTVCPGYTTTLPEVIEAAHARLFWGKGELASFTGGTQPSEALNETITILEVSSSEMQAWLSTPESKGGGGAG